MNKGPVYILGIESSCDETSAAVTRDGVILSNVVAGQEVHARYGGVVPELASRAHQQQIIPVVTAALQEANLPKSALGAIAFTRGPGLIGSLLVGTSFAKAMSLALDIPLIEVNHMQAHVIANFAARENEVLRQPGFPFLCLTVSGGHTQLVLVHDYLDMEIIGQTRDDAAGEAFDKVAKMLGLPYPGGPLVDQWAQKGDGRRYPFPHPFAPGLDFSFSGLKTAVLYFLQREKQKDPDFLSTQLADVCASVQYTIVNMLLEKIEMAIQQTGIREIALAGGVSANSGLREAIKSKAAVDGWKVHVPPFEYCTDNAGMIAVFAHYKFDAGIFCGQEVSPLARFPFRRPEPFSE
ncbi:MAG: tRNA (adenosine(37)-N6)-threonylcarbamoyltransferase complex transferase subunit TsaD [Bacteroidia bacterium]|nr:tRNA (adenosine(37)-N6)-threonylcarbamoyltransferase complex transferase subunit TsaD [Bacteroidia bacterium]